MNGHDDDERRAQSNALVPALEQGVDALLKAPTSGRQVRLRLALGQETVEIVGPTGAIELSVILTEHGPRLVIEAADLQINAVNNIAVACKSFEIAAREGVSLAGATASIAATSGDVAITANDYVKVVGEQIRLNCDGPDRVPAWMEKEISAQLARALRAATPSTTTAALPTSPAGTDSKEP